MNERRLDILLDFDDDGWQISALDGALRFTVPFGCSLAERDERIAGEISAYAELAGWETWSCSWHYTEAARRIGARRTLVHGLAAGVAGTDGGASELAGALRDLDERDRGGLWRAAERIGRLSTLTPAEAVRYARCFTHPN